MTSPGRKLYRPVSIHGWVCLEERIDEFVYGCVRADARCGNDIKWRETRETFCSFRWCADDNWWNDHRGYKVDHDNTDCSRPKWPENAWTRRRGSRASGCVDRDGREWWSSRESHAIGGWFCDRERRRFGSRNHTAHRRFDSILDATGGVFFRRICETNASFLRGRRIYRDCASYRVDLRRGGSI